MYLCKMQRVKQILGIIFLVCFLGFMGNKFLQENWDTPGGDVKVFLVILVLIIIFIAAIRILRH